MSRRAATLAATLLLSACGPPVLAPCDPVAPALQAWVVDYGFHTEIVVPATQLDGALAAFRRMFPRARTLSFGFGKASFFTLRDPGLLDLAAGTVPGPADIRVIPLPDEPQRIYTTSTITRIPLSPAAWSRLEGFLAASFARTASGDPIPAPGDDATGGRFFAAGRGYSLAYTCNAWTVDALHQSGLPVATGALLAGSAMQRVAVVAGSCAAR